MQEQQARSIEIDETLADFRAEVAALQTASVTSVETKSAGPKPAGSTGSTSYWRPSQSVHSGTRFRCSTNNPLAVRQSADVFVRQARAFDERQMEKRLAPLLPPPPLECGQQAYHHTMDPSYTYRQQEERQSVCCGQAFWLLDAFFLVWCWSVLPMFSKSTKRLNFPASTCKNWRIFASLRVPPAGTSLFDLALFLASALPVLATWAVFSCLVDKILTPCPLARIISPTLVTILRTCAPDLKFLQDFAEPCIDVPFVTWRWNAGAPRSYPLPAQEDFSDTCRHLPAKGLRICTWNTRGTN